MQEGSGETRSFSCTWQQRRLLGRLLQGTVYSPGSGLLDIHPLRMTISQSFAVKLQYDDQPFQATMRSLEELRQSFPELVKRFLDRIDSPSQLVRIDTDGSAAATTGDLRVTFQPSNLLLDFLATVRTGKRD